VPAVVLITDRSLAADLAARIALILAGVPAGSVAIQIREKDLDGAALLALAREIVALGAPVWINDRVDIAMLAGAQGVHLPERGLPIADVRAMTDLLIGASRHSAAAAIACDAYVVQLGPIFETPGKRAIGLEPLAEVRAARTGKLVAVGGIDSEERASLAAAAGADAVAVIRAAWTADDPVATVRALIAGVESGRASRSR
jgi:thiamine-phosphate pyrophosphorylase